jgi:hypothetical protein
MPAGQSFQRKMKLDPGNIERAGAQMTTAPATPLISVMHDGRCLGFLLCRGRQGVEVFTRETQSLGCFPTEYEAIGALLNPKGAQS